MRATVDRAGLDPQGRLPKVLIRRIRKGDLSRTRDVFEQTFGDFLGFNPHTHAHKMRRLPEGD